MTNEAIRRNLTLLLAGSRAALDELASTDLQAVLTSLRAHTEVADRAKLLVVKAMRERGASWADIGDALGVTRQAAYLHYHEDVP